MKMKLLVGVLVFLLLVGISTVSASDIRMEYWYAYGPSDSDMGTAISADDVDGDGTVEIVTVGFGEGPGGFRQSSLYIENYDWFHQLEVNEFWNTSGEDTRVGDVFIKDVDNDDVKEILTGGDVGDDAQLRIWNWNGTTLTLEHNEEWTIDEFSQNVRAIYAEDVDGDATVEIVTVGENSTVGQLRIWNWDGTTLTLEHNEEWNTNASGGEGRTFAYSVFVDDVDSDGDKEIVTAGSINSGGVENCQLRIWNWNGTTLTLEHTEEWIPDGCGSGDLSGVFLDDVDSDGDKEIVTAGTGFEAGTQKGYLGIQTWDGSTLTMEIDEKWVTMGGTECFGLYLEDVDDDGDKEIVTVGGLHVAGGSQLRGWTWNGSVLSVEWSKEWSSDGWGDTNFAYDNYIKDVDSDSVMEVLTNGRTIVAPLNEKALVTIWSPERLCTSNEDCTTHEFCLKEIGDCYGTGICQNRPIMCPITGDPVCGCDGETYDSQCWAHNNGVNIAYEGECRAEAPALSPLGLLALGGSLGLIAVIMIRRR